jgi:D-glycero-alpha-D-manno-heptose-7-phosphate kinase
MIISRTPFRMSLAGGGSDIPEYYRHGQGAVVAMSISLYMYVTVNPRFDDTIRVAYTKLEIVDRLDDVRHDLVRESLRMVGVTRGVEITTIADVPGGTGLGSSSSLTVGLLNALYAYRGVRLSAVELARRACEVEIDILKRPIGKQDQYMAACGGLRELTFHPDERVDVRAIRLTAADRARLVRSLLLFYTGIERDSAAVLAEVRQAIATVPAQREALDSMTSLAHDLATQFGRRDFSTVGDVLNRGWAAKRRLGAKVTNGRLDAVYQAALDAGASGAKILGAGGGGFLLVACEPGRRQAIGVAMAQMGLRQVVFDFEPAGSTIVFSGRRGVPATLRPAPRERVAGPR